MKSKKGSNSYRCGCSTDSGGGCRNTYKKKDYGSYRYNSELYFFNETATSIVMENREIKYKDDKELAESVIEALMKGPDNSRYMKIIEKNTKLLSLNDVDSGNIVVNFSGEFLTGDNTKDVLAVYAVVKSLCAISSVDSVKSNC